jgi:chromosome segregation ATPase
MSFNYQKNKEHSQDNFWTSYSDLFLGLSTIFLLLYVTASLRTGTDALRGEIENKKLSMQVEELQQQLKMYESVKNDYIQNQASKDESQEYQELMDKLTLLQEDAKSEKDRLVVEALENDKKAKALNKYQQMVRNVLNANKMAKSKLINRDDLIKEQDVEIDDKNVQIGTLEKDIQQKQNLIAQGEKKIADTEDALSKNISQLKAAYKHNKMTKKAFEARLNKMQDEGDRKIQALADKNGQYENQIGQMQGTLAQVKTELSATQNQLGATQGQLNTTKGQLKATRGQLNATQGQLNDTRGQLDATTGELSATKGQLGATQGQLNSAKGQLNSARGQLAAAAGELNATKGELNATKGELNATKGQLGNAEGQLNAARGELSSTKGQLAATAGELSATKGQLGATQGQLAKAKAELDARKAIASEIQKGFAKAGVKADIDLQTGDVVLDFGNAYFDNDSDRLKNQMKGVLEKAVPIYSKSLFGNPKIANKISAVEIVGYASPTYKGRFVDPNSTAEDDRNAIKYNMDLSYRRAKSIFNYVIDDKNVKFDHQHELLGLMKVSGRSYLEVMNLKNRNIANAADFCKLNDCKKAQRVIIKFSMDQKK